MPETMPVPCVNCMEPFWPKRSTAKFCGGTCRVQWHRKQKRTPGTPQNLEAEIRADIDGVYRAIQTFTRKYKLNDLAGADYGPLKDALEDLDGFFNCGVLRGAQGQRMGEHRVMPPVRDSDL